MRWLRVYLKSRIKLLRLLSYYLRTLKLLQLSFGIILGTILAEVLHGHYETDDQFALLGVAVMSTLVLIGRKEFVLLSFGFLGGWVLYGLAYAPSNLDKIESFYGEEIKADCLVVVDAELRSFNQRVSLSCPGVPGYILANLPKYPLLFSGQKLAAELKLEEPPVFEEFNYKEFLRSRETNFVAEAYKFQVLEAPNLYLGLQEIKQNILAKIRELFAEPQASLLAGLLVGTRENFPQEFEAQLQASGTTHIIAVSGYNVTVLMLLFLNFAGVIPRRFLYILIAAGLVAFILLVGWYNLPARRAVLMGFVLLISWLTGRTSLLPLGLIYATVLMLFTNPLVWKDISFQLSLGALLGILLFANRLEELFRAIPATIRGSFTPTIAVMVTTLPLTISTFGVTSLVALPANILVLPLVPLASALGALTLIVHSILPAAGDILRFLANFFLEGVIVVIEFMGSLDFASTDNTRVGWLLLAAFSALVVFADLAVFRRNVLGTKSYFNINNA